MEEILAVAENPDYHRVATARILLRQDLVDKHAEMEDALFKAYDLDKASNDEDQAPIIAARIQEMEALMDAEAVPFKFRSVGAQHWAQLVAQHPPTKAQLAASKGADHNPDTFQPVAVAASCVEPDLTVEAAARLRTALNVSQWTELWETCLKVNLGSRALPKSTAAGLILRPSGASETSSVSEESPEASSLEGD